MKEAHTPGTRDPARLPPRMTRETEFLRLLEQRAIIEARLNVLAESLSDDPTGCPRVRRDLRIVASNGVSLSRGGRANG